MTHPNARIQSLADKITQELSGREDLHDAALLYAIEQVFGAGHILTDDEVENLDSNDYYWYAFSAYQQIVVAQVLVNMQPMICAERH